MPHTSASNVKIFVRIGTNQTRDGGEQERPILDVGARRIVSGRVRQICFLLIPCVDCVLYYDSF